MTIKVSNFLLPRYADNSPYMIPPSVGVAISSLHGRQKDQKYPIGLLTLGT